MATDTIIANETGTGPLLPDGTRLGGVELTVTDLERSIRFYEDVIGLRAQRREDGMAVLGAHGETLVTLREQPSAQRPGRESGLYHFALLFPTRDELARAGMRIARSRTAIDGASDHGTHEAIYLPDPDGIGLELAADRPRELWPDLSSPDVFSHGPAPLDVRDLLSTVAAEEPETLAAPGLSMGHLHFHVGDLDLATRFYRDGLGFEVITAIPTAVFVSFARYHHHVAYNLWRGRGAPPAPTDAVGLRHWTLTLGSDAELRALRERLSALGAEQIATDDGLIARDPANIAVRVAVAG